MFNQESTPCVSTICLPKTESGMEKTARTKAMHPTMERVYSAAIEAGKVAAYRSQSDLAELLNVAPQNVNNWEKRGPSTEGLLAIQRITGINATWADSGEGPQFVGPASTWREIAHQMASEWPREQQRELLLLFCDVVDSEVSKLSKSPK